MQTYRTIPELSPEQIEKFWSKVEKTETCWLWTGSITRDGYGTFRSYRAHRVAYTLIIGPIPDDMTLDHVRERGCTNSACVNPDHLEPVSLVVNVMRGGSGGAVNARKTHCIHGHEFTPENTIRRPFGNRGCKACQDARNARSKAERAANRPPPKTHCIHGHEFTPENTWVDRNNGRHCKTCLRERGAMYRRRDGVRDRTIPKSHCIRGHEFTPENTRINRSDGARICIACVNIRNRRRFQQD